MKIVAYDPKYQGDFIKLYKETWQEKPYEEVFPDEEVEATIGEQALIYLALTDTGEVVGLICGYPLCEFKGDNRVKDCIVAEKVFYLADFAVATHQRNRKFGQHLYNKLEQHLQHEGYEAIVLRTSARESNAAIRFYKRNEYSFIPDLFSEVRRERNSGQIETDRRLYLTKNLRTIPTAFLRPQCDYNGIVNRFKQENRLQKIIGISGGADSLLIGVGADDELQKNYQNVTRDYQTRLIIDFISLFRGYRIGILTGGTKGGVPQIAAETAKKMGFPTIGVYPAVGQKHALDASVLDLGICVYPMIGSSQWGDEAAVWTSLIDGVMVLGGRSGTLIENAHLLKINESHLKHKLPLKFIAPISQSGGMSEYINFLCSNPEVRNNCLPPHTITSGVEAARFLLDKLRLSDYFEHHQQVNLLYE